jgi:hypothetical protein
MALNLLGFLFSTDAVLMKMHIEKRHLQAFLEAHPRLHALNEQLHFGNNKSQVFYDQLSEAELASLAKLYQQEVEALQQQAC